MKRGIDPPTGWTSRGLIPDDVDDSRLIAVSLSEQKEVLLDLFHEASFWWYCEENPDYVSKILWDLEEALIAAFPGIPKRLGIKAGIA